MDSSLLPFTNDYKQLDTDVNAYLPNKGAKVLHLCPVKLIPGPWLKMTEQICQNLILFPSKEVKNEKINQH
jgi:hypothetical protein